MPVTVAPEPTATAPSPPCTLAVVPIATELTDLEDAPAPITVAATAPSSANAELPIAIADVVLPVTGNYDNASAFGSGATVNKTNGTALGAGAQTNVRGGVALWCFIPS